MREMIRASPRHHELQSPDDAACAPVSRMRRHAFRCWPVRLLEIGGRENAADMRTLLLRDGVKVCAARLTIDKIDIQHMKQVAVCWQHTQADRSRLCVSRCYGWEGCAPVIRVPALLQMLNLFSWHTFFLYKNKPV